ncbi:MAG: WXG100 family type VII secretion target [Gordonia sp. (in: high G+C Gram-positive bacteria)]
MNQGTHVDVVVGESATAVIKGLVGEMRTVIGRIKNSSAGGLTDWSGTASRSFDNSHTDWHGKAVALEHALDDIESKLTHSFRGYDDVDAEVAAAIVNGAGAGNSGGLDLA